MLTDSFIRMASESDSEAIFNIYAPYVTSTAITFEYDVPAASAFAQRIRDTLRMYPWLVALDGDGIVGFAYASPFKSRAAYQWAAETTIYLKRDCTGRGLGKKLYLALEELLKHQNILNLNACIAYTSAEDAHLTNASMAFHAHMGYTKAAHFTKCGYKFGTWYDMIWMEKILGPHPDTPAPFIPIADLNV